MNRKHLFKSICAIFIALSIFSVAAHVLAQKHGSGISGSPEMISLAAEWAPMNASDAKQEGREKFRENKYGMFIHWGLYSQLGGVWEGKTMEESGTGPTVAEWIMRRKEIPRNEYAKLAGSFNPINFDADQWVAIAKSAGMKYLVITAKHHDGFALYDSEVSEFDVINATPFSRDIIRELEEACKEAGLSFGVYYSHAVDWIDGGDAGFKDYRAHLTEEMPRTNMVNSWDPSPQSFDNYIQNKALPQTRELLNNYELTQVWFDYPGYLSPSHSMQFYKLAFESDPRILISQRVGNGFGDIGTPGDNVIPEKASANIWEGIATTNHSWGYKSYDNDWKSPIEILFWLLENVSKGGNFLLNIGPDGSGAIPAKSIENLLAVGDWLEVNGDAIYGTVPWVRSHEGPTKIAIKGTAAVKNKDPSYRFKSNDFWFTEKEDKVYVIALVRPEIKPDSQEASKVIIQSLRDLPIKEIRLLGSSDVLDWTQKQNGTEVRLPTISKEGIGYALEVSFE